MILFNLNRIAGVRKKLYLGTIDGPIQLAFQPQILEPYYNIL
jgi:hypothetical protein